MCSPAPSTSTICPCLAGFPDSPLTSTASPTRASVVVTMSLTDFASSGVETIRPRDGFGSIGGHPSFAAGNYERAAVVQVRRGIRSGSKLIESLDMAQTPQPSDHGGIARRDD